MTFTDWISPETPPVRVGTFQRRLWNGQAGYSYWNGRWWGLHGESAAEAFMLRRAKSSVQDLWWRGLAKEPQ